MRIIIITSVSNRVRALYTKKLTGSSWIKVDHQSDSLAMINTQHIIAERIPIAWSLRRRLLAYAGPICERATIARMTGISSV